MIELNPVKPLPVPIKLDYKFSGRYTVTEDGSPPRGYTVKLSVDLIDLAKGAKVKSAQSTWTCVPKEVGYCLNVRLQETIKLAKTFQPLDKLIYDYERIPETVKVELEKDPILGECLEDFKVFRGRDGIIDIEYQAPETCKKDVETLIVMNSCSIRPDLPAYPEKEIMRKQFNIFCVEGKINIKEDRSSLPSHPMKA